MEYFAFREDENGRPQWRAGGTTADACEQGAIRSIKRQYGSGWEEEMEHVWIGTLENISQCSHWSLDELQDELDNCLAAGVEILK